MPGWNPKANDIFLEALELKTPADQQAFIDERCGDDADLREQVESLIAASQKAGNFLEDPAVPAAPLLATADQPITEQPGTQIGPYKLLQQLGEGGMGVVYMAEQKEPVKRRVALKIIKPGMDTRQVIARFEAERQALAMMDHPNIAKVLDAGATESGRPYFVMELVNGLPVTKYCDEQHLTPKERLELFVPICQAVQHAHQKGIIHRDLKPSNILVALYDGQPVPKVIDFGVAKATSQTLTEKTMFTQLGQVVGTLEYMSPEQAERNQLDIDTRSDIYSLGVVLYELLTGDTPFDRTRLRSAAFDEMLRIIREEEPPRPSTKLSSSQSLPSIAANRHIEPQRLSVLVRGELDWIVMKALEKDRGRRYETASKFADDVQHYLNDEAVVACPPTAVYKFRKFVRRNKGRLVTVSLLGAALLMIVGVAGWAVRDRVAQRAEVAREKSDRQKRVTTQVELLLADADRRMQEQEWEAALATAQRAQAALSGGEAAEHLNAKVHAIVTDLQMVERIEEIRLLCSEVVEQKFDYEGTNRRYSTAFQQYGVDADHSPTDESAAWLRERTHVLPALISALDHWADCRGRLNDDAGSKTLYELSQAVDPDAWRRRVRKALLDNDATALDELADSRETAHQTPSTTAWVAHALSNSGRSDRASEILTAALADYPNDFWLHWERALSSTTGEDEVRHYSAALALRPRSVAVLNNFGNALKGQGKLDEAIAYLRKAIELDPKFAMAHQNLGNPLYEQGKLDEAIACYRIAIELDVKLAPAHYMLGRALRDQEKLDEAINCYREAIEIDPEFADPHYCLGLALYAQSKPDEAISCYREAIACYRKAIDLDPKLTTARYNLGRVLVDLGVALQTQGNLDEAINCYREAIEHIPKEALAHHDLGIVLQRQGKLDEAIASYNRAIELEPNYAVAHTSLGNVLHDQGKSEEAIAHYNRAIELDPKFAIAHHNLGVVLQRRGKLDEAIASYNRAIELNPADPAWPAHLAWILSTAEDVNSRSANEAVRYARRAIELAPRTSTYWNYLGVALFRAGDFQAAVDAFEKAKVLSDSGGGAHRMVWAMACWNSGEHKEAVDHFIEAAKWGYQNPLVPEQYAFRAEAVELFAESEPDGITLILETLSQRMTDQTDLLRRIRAELYAEQGAWNDSAADYAMLLDKLPDSRNWGSARIWVCRELSAWPDVFDRLAALRPNDAALWIGRALERLLESQWKEALEDYAHVSPASHSDNILFEYSALLVLLEDQAGYRELCQNLSAGELPETGFAAYINARTCSISPYSGVEPTQLVEWANQCVAESRSAWNLHVLGLARYRAGQLEEAIDVLQESNQGNWLGQAKAQNHLVLAMAHYSAGRLTEASEWLQRAQWMIDEARRAPHKRALRLAPPDWIALAVLRQEAEKLIEGSGREDTAETVVNESLTR